VGTTGSIEFKAQSSNESVQFPLSHSPTTRKEASHLTKGSSGKGKRKLEMNTSGAGSGFLTPHSVSMSSSDDLLTTKIEEKSSTTIFTPYSATVSASAGTGEDGEVVDLDARGASTAQGGGGTVDYHNVGTTEEDEVHVKARWTRETIDSLEPRKEDGSQPHLLPRADWSTSLLTVLARARELEHMIGMEAADIAQLGAQIADSQSGKTPNDAELLVMFGKLTKETKAVALQHTSTVQAQPAQLSAAAGEGGGGKELHWCLPEWRRCRKTQVSPPGSLPSLRKR